MPIKITIDDIRKNSISYANMHRITQEDADKATELHNIIDKTRNYARPIAGDIMICIGLAKTYRNGHIAYDDLSEFASICTQPYVPFVTEMRTKIPRVSFDTSGGYWFSIPKDKISSVHFVEQRIKLFKAWGHCGACANGAFHFECKVNVWSYEAETIY